MKRAYNFVDLTGRKFGQRQTRIEESLFHFQWVVYAAPAEEA